MWDGEQGTESMYVLYCTIIFLEIGSHMSDYCTGEEPETSEIEGVTNHHHHNNNLATNKLIMLFFSSVFFGDKFVLWSDTLSRLSQLTRPFNPPASSVSLYYLSSFVTLFLLCLFILSQFPAIDSVTASDPYLDQKLPVHIAGQLIFCVWKICLSFSAADGHLKYYTAALSSYSNRYRY